MCVGGCHPQTPKSTSFKEEPNSLPCRVQPCTPNSAIPSSMKLQILLPPLNAGVRDVLLPPGLCRYGQVTQPLWAWYLLLKGGNNPSYEAHCSEVTCPERSRG